MRWVLGYSQVKKCNNRAGCTGKKKNELKSEQQIPWDRKKIARTATIKA